MKRVLKKATQKFTLNANDKADHLWEIIKIPLFILALSLLLITFLPTNISDFQRTIFSTIGLLVSIFSFGYVGYKSVKIKNETKFALKAGAYTGGIIGFVAAVLGIVVFYAFPDRVAQTVSDLSLVYPQFSYDQIKSLFVFTTWFNLLSGTLLNTLMGALISWLIALLFTKSDVISKYGLSFSLISLLSFYVSLLSGSQANFVFVFISNLVLPFFLLGLIFSIWGLIRVNKNKSRGKGLAIAGIIISGIIFLFFVLLIALIGLASASN